MRWYEDKTGQFQLRPFYDEAELDALAEALITEHVVKRRGAPTFPITTDDLTTLIEAEAAELNVYADLSNEGSGVEGVTEFFADRKPNVAIAEHLSTAKNEHRYRTTLAHEYGHVRLHTPLFTDKLSHPTLDLFGDSSYRHKCHRDSIANAPKSDWMEWQAYYMSGALLMPISTIKLLLAQKDSLFTTRRVPVRYDSTAEMYVGIVSRHYQVSREAAEVRLLQQKLIGRLPGGGLI